MSLTGTMIHAIHVYTQILHIALAPMYHGRRVLLGVWCHTVSDIHVCDGISVNMPDAIFPELILRHLFFVDCVPLA